MKLECLNVTVFWLVASVIPRPVFNVCTVRVNG